MKARPRTIAMEVITVMIWIMTNLWIVIAAIAARVMRPVGV